MVSPFYIHRKMSRHAMETLHYTLTEEIKVARHPLVK
jgi:hypothetical protein